MICFTCTHSKADHEDRTNVVMEEDLTHICWQCASSLPEPMHLINLQSYHKFEDSLDYIERKAKERNLI